MSDLTPKPFSRRRLLLIAGLGAGAAAAGWRFRAPDPARALDAEAVSRTLLSFTGALFGRTLSATDAADLSGRIAYLQSANAALRRDCAVLAAYLDAHAAQRGSAEFDACSPAQKESIIDELMRIDGNSTTARLLSHFSRGEREYYRMRWSAVPQLAWLYRHSSAAWRARGYTRWPGVRGDWHEVLVPGPAYP